MFGFLGHNMFKKKRSFEGFNPIWMAENTWVFMGWKFTLLAGVNQITPVFQRGPHLVSHHGWNFHGRLQSRETVRSFVARCLPEGHCWFGARWFGGLGLGFGPVAFSNVTRMHFGGSNRNPKHQTPEKNHQFTILLSLCLWVFFGGYRGGPPYKQLNF